MTQAATHRWSILLLVLTTLVWGTTFPLLKNAVADLSPAVIVCSRFVIGAIVLLPFCRQINRPLLRDGTLLGAVLYCSYVTQVIGLQTTSSNRSAFITSLNVILVPIFGVLLGRRLSWRVGVAAGLALAGIGVLSWEGGALTIGDLWVLGCAVSYAAYILLMESIAPKHPPLALTVVQLIAIALLGLLWAAPQIGSQLAVLQANWGAIVYLGIAATAMTTWTQAIAQRSVSATETAIIYALEPIFAAVFAFWWIGERLGMRGWMGGAMVMVAMVLSQIDDV
jgi:drug/metabolite transporter (DMT)-like permease